MYVAPQYLPPEQQDLPAEYDGDEGPDYALDAEDRTTEILKDLDITDYYNVENIVNQPEITPQKTRSYLNKVIYNGNFLRNQLKGYKTQATKAYNKGEINEAQRAQENTRIDDGRVVFNQYINYYETKTKGNTRFRNAKKRR